MEFEALSRSVIDASWKYMGIRLSIRERIEVRAELSFVLFVSFVVIK